MKTRILRPLFIPIIAGALMTGFATTSCNNNKDSKEVADDQNAKKFDNKVDDNNANSATNPDRSPNKMEQHDADFVVRAQNANLAEIYVSQQALTRSTNSGVKSLAQMMIDDHTKAADQTRALAGKYNISLPTQPSEDDIKNWKGLLDKKGKDFDKDYVDWLVKSHKDAVDDFEKQAKDKDTQPEVQTFATNMIPALNKHLQMAQKQQDMMK